MAKQILSFLIQCQYGQRSHMLQDNSTSNNLPIHTIFAKRPYFKVTVASSTVTVEVFFVLFFVFKFQIKILCDC